MAFATTLTIQNRTSGFKYRRAIFAYIDKDGKEKYVDGLDIKFEIKSGGEVMLPIARIDVCNLETEVMKRLTTIYRFDNNNRVALYVGYEDNLNGRKKTILPKIFEGRIQHSAFTFIPDMWLEMYCLADKAQIYDTVFSEEESLEVLGITNIKGLIDWLKEKLRQKGYSFSVEVNEKDFKDIILYNILFRNTDTTGLPFNFSPLNFNIAGKNAIEVLRQIGQTYNLSIWGVSENHFVIKPKTNYIKDDKSVNVKWEIKAETGMIGVPTISVQQAEVTVLMNPRIYAGDGVNLYSRRYKGVSVQRGSNAVASNGKYTVYGVTHRGHLRGNEWYSKLLMTRGGW